jgi:hypothetical protein
MYNLAEMIILARCAENIAKCSGDTENQEKYKNYKEMLMGQETYKTVTTDIILLAAEELKDMNNEEITYLVDTLTRSPTP